MKDMMRDSITNLQAYLQKEYIDNPSMGSPDMYAALRDLLTDVCHISKKHNFDPHYLMEDAEEVFDEELDGLEDE